MHSFKGLQTYGGFNLRVAGFPKFSAPLVAKLYIRPPKVFEIQECVQGPLLPWQVWWGSDFTRRPTTRWPKTLSFQSVHFFVFPSRFWTTEFVCMILPWNHQSIETILILFDRERFVVVHPCWTFSICRQLATPQNVAIQKNGKIWSCLLPKCDRINWSRQNLAHKHRQ